MLSFLETLLFSAIMGLAIFLSMPVILHRRIGDVATRILTAFAIGILIFLMGDIFSDASLTLYNGTLFGYGSSPGYDITFTLSLAGGFLVLYFVESRSKKGLSPLLLGLVIALGMGFQNLTEGLVFGALGVKFGLTGAALVVLIGFIFQNVTEGFPIASPFLGRVEGRIGLMIPLFLIGGVPTIVGGGIGYYYNSATFDLIFDGVAIGCILYAILPMLRMIFREADRRVLNLSYVGVFIGFLLGFIVNLV